MTFNVRYAADFEGLFGPDGWYNLTEPGAARRLKAFEVIETFGPDVLGLQEPLDHQMQDLAGTLFPGQGLADYDFYGVGRNDGQNGGEFAPIFYRRDRFVRIDEGTFWISATPNAPGSIFPGAGEPRIASWVVLDDLLSRQRIFVLNTHLDNVSSAARNLGGQLIQSHLGQLAAGMPILVLGDFNATESSQAVRALTAPAAPDAIALVDAYRALHALSPNERTFHDFQGGTVGSRIDFILASSDFTIDEAAIVRTSYDGRYPSDHYPVTARLQLALVPEPSTSCLALAAVALGTLGAARRRGRKSSLHVPPC